MGAIVAPGNLLMRIVLALFAASLTATAGPKPGDEGTPEFDKASALVKQLGHARFPVREAAAKRLVEMGGAAVGALVAGTKSDDEEVRTRSAALLPQAKAADWKRRADAYLADKDGKEKHVLPLLTEWEKLVGKPDVGSRKLFAEMIQTSGELLEKAATNPKAASSAATEQARLVRERVHTSTGQLKAEPGELAALFFVEAVATEPVNLDGGSRLNRGRLSAAAQLLANPTWAEALDAADTGPALRKLLGRWASDRPVRDHMGNQQFALLAQKKPFAEAAPALAAVAKNKDADLLSVRLIAVQALGKVGGKEADATLTDLIGDTSTIFGGLDEHRLGDSALAALILMHGKKLSDYGLTNNIGIGFAAAPGDEPIMLQIHGFLTPDHRTRAIKKWKEEVKKDPPAKSDK
jgi:hypothetical protein